MSKNGQQLATPYRHSQACKTRISEHVRVDDYPRWQRYEEIGPRLTSQGGDDEDEEDNGACAEVLEQSRAAGGGSLEPSVDEELFGSKFYSDDECQSPPISPFSPGSASDEGDTDFRSPSEDDAPADE